jgi:glutamine synthetase
MQGNDIEYVLKVAHESQVRFIRLWFTDILGMLKSVAVTMAQLEDALENGVSFDGSSVQGFARREESDMRAKPDPGTFQLLPWRKGEQGAVAALFCDIINPDGTPYEGDPRWVLRRTLQRAAERGYNFYVGPELEFFYFRSSRGVPETLDEGGYFDLTPQDVATDIRRDTILTLESMGIDVDFSHHEGAHSQHEIDLRYADALTMADNTMTFRLVVKEIAQKYGVYATFMPKPLQGQNGSGMHINTSLFHGSRNLFYDADDPQRLSLLARRFIAGLLAHSHEITLVLNQWVNSYKRLVPGYEAPGYITWALQNRSDLIRVPAFNVGREDAVRLELRSPDPACNPYLAFACVLSAGLDGMEKEYAPPAPMERNVAEMTDEERARAGIRSLPEDLHAAIECAQGSELLRRTLGDHVFTKLIENKRMEWDRYRRQVTNFELEEYLPIL